MKDTYDIEYAKDPYYGNELNEFINLTVKFAGFSNEVPYTAMENDTVAHGRLLYHNAKAGLYGEIKPFPYSAQKQALYDADVARKRATQTAIQKLQKLGLTDEEIQALTGKKPDLNSAIDPRNVFPVNVPGFDINRGI